ncbi:MAG: UDP-N-acetylmuramoyl-L-alanine--D-glutamate ligase, partial [Clostridia bacterium]|nr:UDP-N-acetylmuramoyl-L-alanine--D-glutamate ligase [Clostridia bacterium]
NWHTDYCEYIEAKKRILGDYTVAILNAQNEQTAKIAEGRSDKIVFSAKMSAEEMQKRFPNSKKVYEKGGYIVYYDGNTEFPILKTEDIKIPGIHNVENYMAAFALTLPYADFDIVKDLAKEFSGVEHRLEFVRTHKGVKYYNSSIDSSPVRTAAALSALKEKPIVICGGASKGIPFDLLATVLCERAKAVVLTGETANEIENALKKCDKLADSELKIIKAEGFLNAVLRAKEEACEGDTVLLSPACTSFDAFKNFNERGSVFKSIVNSFED